MFYIISHIFLLFWRSGSFYCIYFVAERCHQKPCPATRNTSCPISTMLGWTELLSPSDGCRSFWKFLHSWTCRWCKILGRMGLGFYFGHERNPGSVFQSLFCSGSCGWRPEEAHPSCLDPVLSVLIRVSETDRPGCTRTVHQQMITTHRVFLWKCSTASCQQINRTK